MKEGWIYSTIDECCNVNYGTRVVRSEVTGDKYPVYGGGGETFRMDEYNREDCLVVSRFAMSKQCTRIVRGKFYLNDSGLTVSPKPNSGLLPTLLDRYLLASNDIIYSFGRGSAQRNLNMIEFRKLKVSYPTSLAEQQSIVEYLDSSFAKIDAMKANAEKSLNEAKALFQASLKSLLEPKDGWTEKNVGDVISHLRTGLNPRVHFKLNTEDAEGYYITVRELKGFTIEPDAKTDRVNDAAIKRINERSNLKIGDVLFSGTGTIGKTALVTELPETWNIKEGVYAMTPKHSELDSKWFIYYIGADFFLDKVKAKATGTGVQSIPMKELVKFPIYLPALSEQQTIVATLDDVKAKVDQLQANYDQLSNECDALKQALLKQVFE